MRAKMADANDIDRTARGRLEDGKWLVAIDVASRLRLRCGLLFELAVSFDVVPAVGLRPPS